MIKRLVYRIDHLDRIAAVGEDWCEFARTNDGSGLADSPVVGRKLMDFITDETVRQIYAAIIARARQGRTVQFRYRCDAPDWRREFEMEVLPLTDHAVEFRSTLLRESQRPPIRLFAAQRVPAGTMVRMCSWCHAVAGPDGQWLPLETALATMPVLEQETAVGVTHGMCPPCGEAMLRLLSARPAP